MDVCVDDGDDGRSSTMIASGSLDNTIKIWNVEEGECTQTLRGHTDDVLCLYELLDGRLVSGSADKTLCVWEEEEAAYDGYDANVSPSGYYRHRATLAGHSRAVNCVIELQSGLIASGSDDKSVWLWNLSTFDCVRTLRSTSVYRVSSIVEIEAGVLLSGSPDRQVFVWSERTGECIYNASTSVDVTEVKLLRDRSLLHGGSRTPIHISETWVR